MAQGVAGDWDRELRRELKAYEDSRGGAPVKNSDLYSRAVTEPDTPCKVSSDFEAFEARRAQHALEAEERRSNLIKADGARRLASKKSREYAEACQSERLHFVKEVMHDMDKVKAHSLEIQKTEDQWIDHMVKETKAQADADKFKLRAEALKKAAEERAIADAARRQAWEEARRRELEEEAARLAALRQEEKAQNGDSQAAAKRKALVRSLTQRRMAGSNRT